jgi:nicotinamidase-related amidase
MALDMKKTAFLTLDLQKGIFGFAPAAESLVGHAAKALAFARSEQILVVHVGMGFSEGHPEIADWPPRFLQVKQNNLFVKGSPSAEFHEAIYRAGEPVVYKQRVGGFTENHLDLLLRTRGIEHLVLFGVSTSGIVLSTVRRASDLDYQCTVLKDACFDSDDEVHRVLTTKVFPAQASVHDVDEFLKEQGK